ARGFALSEIAGFTLESRPRPAQPAPDPGSLPPENFPNLVELAPWLADPDRDAAFELGTELLLDGIDRRAGA
ncbi:MAG: TetR/AcrR family transcriptional regulator C-terminal domain-containing protein, partial [Candidatus Binatia bacterium]